MDNLTPEQVAARLADLDAQVFNVPGTPVVPVCTTCNGTGIKDPGTPWVQFCPDCVTGNALALKACGSSLDPAKYPACHYDIDSPGCNDQGIFPDGSSCDCDRVSILGFESNGLSHEDTIKVMAVLTGSDYGPPDQYATQFDQLDEIMGSPLGPVRDNATQNAQLTAWVQAHPDYVQYALDNSYLREYL